MRRVDPLLGNCSLSELRQRKSVKWREYPPEVLPSFVAEMDFTLAEPIVAAVTEAMAMGDGGYAHPGQLADAFAQFAADRLDWAPETAHIYPVPDVMTGLAEVVQAITPPGSGIVVNPPVYPPFRFRFGFYGRRLIDAPMARGADGRYALDPHAIDAALSEPDAAAYVLCSPHNPTGNVWSRADLAMVADACQRHGAALLVDEIHAPLALPGAPFVPFLATDHDLTRAETTFTFTSATKGWNIPGLKCGLAVAGTPAGARLLKKR
jgi:cystathionine beta-lyase